MTDIYKPFDANPTISHGKINMQVSHSLTIFLCQEIFSLEFIFLLTLKTILSELVLFEGFITFIDFQFQSTLINIIHYEPTSISFLRKKRQNENALYFSFNFIFIIEEMMRNIAPDFQMPQNHIKFDYFQRKILPQTSALCHISLSSGCPRPH